MKVSGQDVTSLITRLPLNTLCSTSNLPPHHSAVNHPEGRNEELQFVGFSKGTDLFPRESRQRATPIEPASERVQHGPGRPAVFETAGERPKQPEDVDPFALFLATCPEPGLTAQIFSLMRRQG